jgi:hypothetical protein
MVSHKVGFTKLKVRVRVQCLTVLECNRMRAAETAGFYLLRVEQLGGNVLHQGDYAQRFPLIRGSQSSPIMPFGA